MRVHTLKPSLFWPSASSPIPAFVVRRGPNDGVTDRGTTVLEVAGGTHYIVDADDVLQLPAAPLSQSVIGRAGTA